MSTLSTNLNHIVSEKQFNEIIQNEENIMICCGRMGPMCVPVYAEMESLEQEYANVKFYDMLFDSPDAHVIRSLPECSGFMGLPFTVYFKNGKVVKATSSIQDRDQITEILDENFGK